MLLIAHRGNINGPNKKNENKPEYIINAIEKGFYVEIDIWYINDKLYLGHDMPQYTIDISFLLKIKNKIFVHCKNIKSLYYFLKNYPEIECFFHNDDECVITSKNKIWTYPGKELTNISICVMPELNNEYPINCLGICTDYPEKYSCKKK